MSSSCPHCVAGGTLYIASGIWLVREIGSAAYFICLICGQLAGSAAIDATGFLSTPIEALSPMRGAGIIIIVVAAILQQVPGRTVWERLLRWWHGNVSASDDRLAPVAASTIELSLLKAAPFRQDSTPGGDEHATVSIPIGTSSPNLVPAATPDASVGAIDVAVEGVDVIPVTSSHDRSSDGCCLTRT